MGIKKITELTAATTVDGTELIPFVQNGVTKKATLNTVVSQIQVGPQGPAGPQGPTGPQGPAGANGDSFNWAGEWNTATGYLINDVVEFGGSAFIALEVNVSQAPTGGVYWDLFISRGETGATGASGTNGAGVASGGVVGQYLRKASSTDYDTNWATFSLVNNDISSTAQIAYSKLSLSGSITNNDISSAASAQIAWTKISKTGSSLADLTTRSASDLATGTLSDLRLSSNVPLKNSVNAFSAHNYFGTATLTSAAAITWTGSSAQVAQVTLDQSPTLTATGLANGAFYSLLVIQDGVGGRTILWDSNVFKFNGGTAPVLSVGAGAKDVFVFRSDGTLLLEVGRSLGVA